jgi:hypothetical protein
MPASRWWECVWPDMAKGRIAIWKQTYSNRNEWKKATEKVKVHLCMQSQVRKEDSGWKEALRKPKKRWLVMWYELARFSGTQ